MTFITNGMYIPPYLYEKINKEAVKLKANIIEFKLTDGIFWVNVDMYEDNNCIVRDYEINYKGE